MKTVPVEEAVAMIPDGATLMIGGFMGVGSPERVIDELVRQGKRNPTVIANETAIPGRGIGKLVDRGLVARTIASHIGARELRTGMLVNLGIGIPTIVANYISADIKVFFNQKMD